MIKKVLVGGCFDLFHYGHLIFLKKAKAAGDILIVALEPDETIQRKGRLPVHTQAQRKEILESLACVDAVFSLGVLSDYAAYLEFVKKISPHIIAVTEGDPYLLEKKKQAAEVGATVLVVSGLIGDFSTSEILKVVY